MATHIQLWEIKNGKLVLSETNLVQEGKKEVDDLEEWIKSNPQILGEEILIIGEQVLTKSGPLDFIGIDRSGNIIIIELKRDRLPREALAQAIDYTSDVSSWDVDKLDKECSKYTGKSLEKYLMENFEKIDLEEISINQFQKIILVGTEVEESLERMVEWLSDNYDMSINVLILKYTKTKSGDEIIARTTIIPEDVEMEKSQRHQGKIYEERHRLRKEFWAGLLEIANKKTNLFSGISPGIYSWIGTGAGKSGMSYNFVIHNKYARVEIYLDKGKGSTEINKKRFDSLLEHREEIERKFGDKLEWERLDEDETRASRIAYYFRGFGLKDSDKWDALRTNLVDSMIKLEESLKDYIKRLD